MTPDPRAQRHEPRGRVANGPRPTRGAAAGSRQILGRGYRAGVDVQSRLAWPSETSGVLLTWTTGARSTRSSPSITPMTVSCRGQLLIRRKRSRALVEVRRPALTERTAPIPPPLRRAYVVVRGWGRGSAEARSARRQRRTLSARRPRRTRISRVRLRSRARPSRVSAPWARPPVRRRRRLLVR